MKEESEKAGLKLNTQKSNIMAFSTITSWQIDGEKVEAVRDFIWGAPKSPWMVTAAMKFKDLLLGRKVMTNLDKPSNRDITLMTKVHIVKAMIFSVVLYGCESWTIKKSEHCRNDTFKLVLEKILESPLDKEIKSVNPKGNQP